MGHAYKWSLKVVLYVTSLKMATVPRFRAGMKYVAHRWLEAVTVTTAAKLVAAVAKQEFQNFVSFFKCQGMP